MMETALVAAMKAQAPLFALVGQRIYPTEFPQQPAAWPAMSYQTISGPRGYTQAGWEGITQFRVQVRIRGLTPASANAVRDALVAPGYLLGRHLGGFGSPEIVLNGVFAENETTESDPPLQPEGTKLYGMRMDLVVWATAP